MSDSLKHQVGVAALDYVQDGMRLGIGTGSTAEAFIKVLAERVKEGLNIIGVPTSQRTAHLCQELGIALTTLEETPVLDLTIDGADEIDPQLNLIKGGGGALLREKIVASASKSLLVIADESKLVACLGQFPLPVEVNIFGLAATQAMIEKTASRLGLSGDIVLRQKEDAPFVTDGGHYILDASFGRIVEPQALAVALNAVPGVVEHGLFTGLSERAIIAGQSGVKMVRPNTQ